MSCTAATNAYAPPDALNLKASDTATGGSGYHEEDILQALFACNVFGMGFNIDRNSLFLILLGKDVTYTYNGIAMGATSFNGV